MFRYSFSHFIKFRSCARPTAATAAVCLSLCSARIRFNVTNKSFLCACGKSSRRRSEWKFSLKKRLHNKELEIVFAVTQWNFLSVECILKSCFMLLLPWVMRDVDIEQWQWKLGRARKGSKVIHHATTDDEKVFNKQFHNKNWRH